MSFKIVKEDGPSSKPSLRQQNRIAVEARFEREWLQNPEQFNPNRNVKEQERIKRTLNAIRITPCKGCDLGIGYGTLSDALIDKGFEMDAIDVATNALKRYQGQAKTSQDYAPYTKLDDNAYSLVLAADLIANLPESEHRLLISELARLIKPDGTLIISTPIDIDSEDAASRFLSLVHTEFDIEEIIPSHHALWIRLWKWHFLRPLLNQKKILTMLEGISRYFYHDNALSHLIVSAKRRPLFVPPAVSIEERKQKRTVWE